MDKDDLDELRGAPRRGPIRITHSHRKRAPRRTPFHKQDDDHSWRSIALIRWPRFTGTLFATLEYHDGWQQR